MILCLKSTDLLSTDDLRLRLERTWIQHIKLCQDNFLYFVKNVWPEFICKTEKNKDDWGHHQIIAKEFTDIASKIKMEGSL